MQAGLAASTVNVRVAEAPPLAARATLPEMTAGAGAPPLWAFTVTLPSDRHVPVPVTISELPSGPMYNVAPPVASLKVPRLN